VSAGLFLDDIQSGVFRARRIVAPTLSREFFLIFRRDLPDEVLDFVRSTIRDIVERRHRENQLGWRRLSGVARNKPEPAMSVAARH
jgi:hypothetical protein